MRVLILIFVWMWAVPSFADYQAGTDAFDRGDLTTALREFRALAETNDAKGQYGLAIMYDLGEGVPQSSEEAAKWYKLSAEQGYPDAQNNLGVMFEEGEGVERNYEEAMKWYRKAAESGNKDAPNNIGIMYMTGQGVVRDYVQAGMWFAVAGKGDPDARSNMKFLSKKISSEEMSHAHNLAKEWLEIQGRLKSEVK